MFTGYDQQRFIGCSTDSAYVDMTCAMLASLARHGEMAHAIVLIASFSLRQDEQLMLRESAGPAGATMRFVTVQTGSDLIVALPSFDFPKPLLGRLILPRIIEATASRLLLLDSDMIVNGSLGPLLDIDMGGRALAAVGDRFVMKHYQQERYFNAGMMLLDLDRFNARDLGGEAMRWLAHQSVKPDFLDQDALNTVVGNDWIDVDRRWNFFHADDPEHFTRADYQAAHIIHFAGRKPWEDHVACGIYDASVADAVALTGRARSALRHPISRDFLASCYEVLLGRELEDPHVARDRANLTASQLVQSVVACDEFRDTIYHWIASGGGLPPGRFSRVPSNRQRYWAADRLPIVDQSSKDVEQATDWQSLLQALCGDAHLMHLAGLPTLVQTKPPAC